MRATREDQLALIRLAGLIGRHREVLADFEAELVDDCVRRFRDRGAAMTLTDNERHVVMQALAGLDRAAADARGEMRPEIGRAA